MHTCHEYSIVGFISGEIYLAIAIQLMSGALYLDLSLLYVTSYSHIYKIIHYVNEYWICNNGINLIIFFKELTDIEAMK